MGIAGKFSRIALLSLAGAMVSAGIAMAQAPAKGDYQPEVGQQGKDVVWVPTAQAMVNKMLDLAKVTPNDFVMDLGSGDGRTVITAAKRGARSMGIEYNPDMVGLSRRNAAKDGVADKAFFMKADLFETDFSQASVVTMFLLPSINTQLRPKILDMKPGTRIVSNSFDMGDWQPDVTAEVKEGCQTYCRVYHWVVPAKVEGKWKVGDGELELKQTYQMLSGTMKNGGTSAAITDAKMNGHEISFKANGVAYKGYVIGKVIEGVTGSGDKLTSWTATR